MIHHSSGICQYGPGIEARLVIDQSIINYYRSLFKRKLWSNTPGYNAHITWVRLGKESPTEWVMWEKHQGEAVDFTYEDFLWIGRIYITLRVWSPKLCEFRRELGMPPFRVGHYPFHITVGNFK